MSVFSFFRNVRREFFENTTWPTKDVVLQYTIWVVMSLFVAALFLFGVDYLSSFLVSYFFVDRVYLLKEWLEWILEFRLGVPFRFLSLIFGMMFVSFLIRKIFVREIL